MMTAAQGAAQIWPDVLCCLGQGLLVACLYDAARSVLGRARLTLFVLDLAGFLLAGLMVFSYGASRSWAGSVRGYMVLALLAGDLAYFGAVAPLTRAVEKRVKWTLSRPFALALWLIWPLAAALWRAREKARSRRLEKRLQKEKKRLQKNSKLLYNSN